MSNGLAKRQFHLNVISDIGQVALRGIRRFEIQPCIREL